MAAMFTEEEARYAYSWIIDHADEYYDSKRGTYDIDGMAGFLYEAYMIAADYEQELYRFINDAVGDYDYVQRQIAAGLAYKRN
jgi:hypothetical protein